MSTKGRTSCAVRSCLSKTSQKTVSSFRFPKDSERARIWLIACNREDLIGKTGDKLYNSYKLCARHFEDKYFSNDLKNRLLPTAVPTIFPSLEGQHTLNVRRRMEQNNTEQDNVKMNSITMLAELGDVNKQICRLCFDVISTGDFEVIDETKKEKLEALLINIDFGISDNAVACSKCLEKLQECLDFKSTCSYVGDYVVPFVNVDIKVDIRTVFKKEMSEENVPLKNVQICQLCALSIENESLNYTADSKDGVLLKDMIRNCLPQVDLDTVNEPLICKACLSNTKKYTDFMKTCQEVEERIKNYCQVAEGYGITGKIVLEDVLEFKNSDTLSQPEIIKKECSDIYYVDVNVMDCPKIVMKNECSDVEYIENYVKAMNCPKNEDIASVKCEDIDIKDELDDRVEAGESVDNGSSETGQIGNSASKEEKQSMYFCPKCPYSSNKKYRIKGHKCRPEDKAQKCFICPFVTNAKLLLDYHMASHRGPTKALACPECSLETNRRSNLMTHLLKHKDESEVEMYKCEECTFSTRHKRSFVRHQVLHKNPEEISMHKCDKCGFESKHKKSLVWHKMTHEDPTVVNKFKCDKCTYRTKRLFDLKTHLMIHSDEHQYSCDQCTYSSSIRQYLVRHKRVHQMDAKSGELEIKFLCDQCDFRTKYKSYLLAHKYVHDPTKSTFKCGHCEYSTWRKARLMKHQLQHMELEETVAFYCATCDFKTKYKSNLKNHTRLCVKKKNENGGNKRTRGKVVM